MDIVIIGGGFSALSVAAHLIYGKKPPSSLVICEKGDFPGLGTAYSAAHPWHLLNVRAARMGVFVDDPEGFYHWLQDHEFLWRHVDPTFKELVITPEAFLPRKLYGIYLTEILKDLKKTAVNKNISFEMIHDRAVDLVPKQNRLTIVFEKNQPFEADKAVLAMGVRPIKELACAIPSEYYIGNLWDQNELHLQKQIASTNVNSHLCIIGTGLTTIDLVSSLEKLNYQGAIICLSPHGQLPGTHQKHYLPPAGDLNRIMTSKNLLAKYRVFKSEIKKLEKSGKNWEQLFETVRPATVDLWRQLSISDKKRFLRHLLSLWNKHRHRMAPASKEIIDRLFAQGRLKIVKGRVIAIREETSLKVTYESHQQTDTISADFVYNCTGPDFMLQRSKESLIQNLLKRGLITPDPLGLGIHCNVHLQAQGSHSTQIYVMSSLLLGECFETTSVPEIRIQASRVAASIGDKV